MSHHFDNLRYMVVLYDDIGRIDFTEVFETAPDTLRVSVDGVYTFFKWEGDVPSSIARLDYKKGPYTHIEILNILNSPEWVSNPD